ncbi:MULTISPECIES: AraC family transcriptional regulator [Sphingomonadales]|uniref:Transcriptional regulator, AraC family n=1 Tax=Rhizorhabdus wittichii (strain DSM 6014 / CCUG 31198 / JCM 15750 / NBRC 105917 / EY 4224 / RW1) TaxID=392499 RepID=A0A9J9LFL4_RHIWR|nr:transcriptional regulator, AraC family [Rhizorhabdus wittichii RW1]
MISYRENPANEPSSIASYCLMLADLFEAQGLDAGRIFLNAGLSLSALRGSTGRVPIFQIRLLWQQAVALSGNPSIALGTSRVLSPMSYSSMSIAALSSGSLRGAIDKYVRYSRIVTDAIDIRVEDSGDFTSVIVKNYNEFRAPEAMECCLTSILTHCRQLLPNDGIAPAVIELERDKPSNENLFSSQMQSKIRFSAPGNRLIFRNRDIAKPIPGYCRELETQIVQHCDIMLGQRASVSWSTRARQQILRHLHVGTVSERSVAGGLHTSVDTLRRRLNGEGTSYRALLDDVRRTLAERYLENRDLSIKQISGTLGFANSSAFVRAFRRWTGHAPGIHRQEGALG